MQDTTFLDALPFIIGLTLYIAIIIAAWKDDDYDGDEVVWVIIFSPLCITLFIIVVIFLW